MFTINDILTDAYSEAYATSEYKASNTLWLKHLSLIVQDIWSEAVNRRITASNWNIWKSDTVALQNEYTLASSVSTSVGTDYVESVSVAYNGDTYNNTWNLKYIPCRYATDREIANWEYYLENQSNLSPIYFERDGSVFIAPDPRSTEIWTGRVQIRGIRSIDSSNWTTSTSESDIKLPVSAWDTMKLGLVWKIHAYLRRDRAIIIDAKNEYLNSKEDFLGKLFSDSPFTNVYPDERTDIANNPVINLTTW